MPINFSLALRPLPLTTCLLALALTKLDQFCPTLPCLATCLAPYPYIFPLLASSCVWHLVLAIGLLSPNTSPPHTKP